MDQAPAPVNQTITNVVERTIEKITPTFIEKPGKQVIIKDEDLVVSAIDRNVKSVIAFRVTGEAETSMPAGVGTIVSSDGLVITDRGNFGSGVLVTTIDGVKYALEVLSNEKENSLGVGRLTLLSGTSTPAFSSAVLGNSDTLRLGQTAIIIGGRDGKTITTGLVNNLDSRTIVDKDTKNETKVLTNIGVSTRFAGTSNGAPIITLSGDIVGFLSIDDNIGSQAGVPSSEAKRLLDEVTKTLAEKNI